MSFWVYILRCSDGSYYTGHTDNLESRIAQHVTGVIPSCYTFNRRPVECLFSQDLPTREEALAAEQQIKGWGRKKKEAMIRGDWAEVSRLARSSVRPLREVGELAKGERLADTGLRQAQAERKMSVRPEVNRERQTPVRPEPEHTPVRPEPVEGRHAKG